ncbi:MAG: metallopeptidase family protein [Dehalococcoidales bacterium]|nr:metallopeptidase family protein [Dehalococcoidales bacterium]
MDRARFEELVAEAVSRLPADFSDRLENIDVVVEEWPLRRQLNSVRLKRGHTLLGLYEGLPLIERGRGYGLVAPDKITIFQGPIEAECRDEDEIRDTIQRVVRHEIAHHFGTGEARLAQLEHREEP